MAKIDYKDMELGRINQINIEIKQAIYKKDWKLKAKLEAEKVMIEKRIKNLA